LDALRAELPDLFEDAEYVQDWEEDWHFWRVDEEEEGPGFDEMLAELVHGWDFADDPPSDPPFMGPRRFPGGPVGARPDPGCIERLAFYLPYHFFHPHWWGIYVLVEGVVTLASQIMRYSGWAVQSVEAVAAAREFLYQHELFHHNTESFATRLEVVHRTPLYRRGMRDFYNRTLGTDACLEEALANGSALLKSRVSPTACDALRAFVRVSPAGYRLGIAFSDVESFCRGRAEFAEEMVQAALPTIRPASPEIWNSFSHSFTGRLRRTSRLVYVLPRRSPLVHRIPAKFLSPITARKLKKGLREQRRCRLRRQGGRHETWETPEGNTFQIPRHAGDLRPGTVKAILRDAGVDKSLKEFCSQV